MLKIIACLCYLCVSYGCLSVYNDDMMMSSGLISYLNRDQSVTKADMHGVVSLNGQYQDRNYLNDKAFTIHRITLERLNIVDVSAVYDNARIDGFDGLFISSADMEILGGIVSFYDTSNGNNTIHIFEVSDAFLTAMIDAFGTGAYFNITTTDECNPYFNLWIWFHASVYFYVSWVIQNVVVLVSFVVTIYTLIVKWSELLLIFRLCIVFYASALFISLVHGMVFVATKWYTYGMAVDTLRTLDVIGVLGWTNFILAGLLLYVMYWCIVSNTHVDNLDQLTKQPSVVLSFIILTFSGLSVFVLISGSSSTYSDLLWLIYRILYAMILISTTIVYTITMIQILIRLSANKRCLSIFAPSEDDDDIRLRRFGIMFVGQLTCLMMSVLLFISTIVYAPSPVQFYVLLRFMRVIYCVMICVQMNKFLKIEDHKLSSVMSKYMR
jgi:hypothetical protein